MKDLTKGMEIAMKDQAENAEVPAEGVTEEHAEATQPASAGTKPQDPLKQPTVSEVVPEKATEKPSGSSPETSSDKPSFPTQPATSHINVPSEASSGTSTPKTRIPYRPAIADRSDEEVRLDAEMTAEEAELRRTEKRKGGLSKEQREELMAFEAERKRIRDERVNSLAEKLVNRLSVWTEADKRPETKAAFEEKTRMEVENLKMESFGLEILHSIGATYVQKATSFLKSQKFLGISGFFSRLKDKGTLVKETYNTISSVLDAQMTIEEMTKLEEAGGEDWTGERKVEYERRVTGKILAAAWRGSKLEIQSVLRDVCDKVLNDKNIPLSKRVERAHALLMAGAIFQKVRLLHI
jgi:hypothetical protein